MDDIKFEKILEKSAENLILREMSEVSNENFNPSKTFKKKMDYLLMFEKPLVKRDFNLKKVMSILLITFVSMGLLLTFNEGVRARIFRIIETHSDHISIIHDGEDGDVERIQFDLNKLPKEYKVVRVEVLSENFRVIDLQKNFKDEIQITEISTIFSTDIGLDNENIIYKEKVIDGVEVLIGESHNNEFYNTIFLEYNGYFYLIDSFANMENLLEVVEIIIN